MVYIDINSTIDSLDGLEIFKSKIKEYIDNGYTIKSYNIEKCNDEPVRIALILTDHKSLFREFKNVRFIKKSRKNIKGVDLK